MRLRVATIISAARRVSSARRRPGRRRGRPHARPPPGQDDVEALAGRGQVLGRRVAVVDREAACSACRRAMPMFLSDGVDAGDRGAEPRHRLASSPPPQPISSSAQPLERRRAQRVAPERPASAVADEGEPGGVELVQRPELAPRVPPFVGHGARIARLRRDRCWRRSAVMRNSGGGRRLLRHRQCKYGYARPCPATAVRPMPADPVARKSRKWPRIVMKFGGTSVADLERIRNVAALRQARGRGRQRGRRGGLGHGRRHQPAGRLVNQIVAAARRARIRRGGGLRRAGDRGLLALALQELGVHARSWLGWQIPIAPTRSHGKARIQRIDTDDDRASASARGRWRWCRASRARARQPRHHAGPRRLRYLGGGAGRGAEGRPLRHLHRCGRRLHHRPAHRCEGAQAG